MMPAVDFKQILFPFLKSREGYRLDVYRDHKGIPTVGIGHKVLPEDRLKVGDRISAEKLQQLFNQDYARLKIPAYVTERPYNVNQMLAISSFIWGHGDGDFKGSPLHKNLVNGSWTKDQVLQNLRSRWDTHSPKNQTRNDRDFTLYFQPVAGQPVAAPTRAGEPAQRVPPGAAPPSASKGILIALALLLTLKILS